MNKININPIFYEIEKIKKQYPLMKVADIADELNKLGFRKKSGKEYSRSDISHIYCKYLPRKKQLEMVEELRRIRGTNG